MAAMLEFYVNGRKITESKPDPELTLLQYLRDTLRLTGTKLGCGEGGCGACTVMISSYNPSLDKIQHYSANACLFPLCSVHGLAVTTVEGIGSTRTKLHPVQERIAKAHGSQCGFCTPGFVMSMYTLLRNNPQPNLEELDTAFDGNLCRCTGYRPIIDGFRTFTKEYCAMGEQCCKNKKKDELFVETGNIVDASSTLFNKDYQPYDPTQELIFPPELKIRFKDYHEQYVSFKTGRVEWHRPVTLPELLELKESYPDAKVIIGNSEIGIETKFKKMLYKVLISATNISVLNTINVADGGINIGASVTLARFEDALQSALNKYSEEKTRSFKAILEMLRWFAGHQIRNVAAVGGNIMTASPISDLNPLFLAMGAVLTVKSKGASERKIKMDDKFFTGYRKTVIKPSEILVSIFLPFTSANEYMYSFKQAGRKEDDISIVNAGMKIRFKNETNSIEDLSLAFGGMAPTTVMATKTMTGLRNKEWNENIIQAACQLLEKDLPLPPGSPGGVVEYRKTLTTSFFFKFYHFVQSARSKISNRLPSMVLTERPLSKGTQVYEEVPDGQTIEDAIGRPIVHTSAYQQATGEAMYVDDLPIYRDELALVHVLSKVAHGTIKTVDASQALSIPGVVDFITYKDVPGNNTWGPVVFDEEMFVSKEVRCQGAIIGAILADDRRTAERAADLVKVEYEQLDHIVTMEDAIKKNSFHDGVEKELMLQDGDVEEGFNKSDHVIDGEVHIEAQEHFYLETQAALAVPKGEDGEIEVICTTQYLSLTQKIIASLLGVDRNKIICKIKRIGGGFGGKEYRNMLIAAPVAIAANKHNRPVRCSLDRDQDMMMTGTRHPFMAKYKVGFTKEGKLSAIQVKLYSNAGFSKDLSIVIMKKAITHFDLVYNMPNVDIVGGVCKTNIPSNTAFRGFGSIQGMFVTETIMTHIAELLDQCPMKIRDINMYEEEGSRTPYGQILDNCTIKRCWNECLTQAEYEKRQSDISDFNSKNRWRKRGMAINPVKFALSFVAMQGFYNQGGALVHLYTDGSVLISHGGMEMGQGLHTKMIQIASRVFNIPISKIFISETSTDKVPNTTPTATSTGSDLNGAAVLDACEKLMKRLQPVIDANPKGNWEQWINAAYFERVNLSATGFYKTDDLVYDTVNKTGRLYSYFTYGVACTEVEIDCLTGDHQVIRTDIVMDVGRSMNPAIDIGQIEGAFTQGYGMFVIEEYKVSPDGTLLTRGPGNYKIPTYGNIPAEFNVSLLKGASNPRAVYSSKGIGEPPLFLACSALFAIKAAIRAARIEAGYSKIFRLDSPATSCRIRMACQDQFTQQFPPAEKGTYKPWYVDL